MSLCTGTPLLEPEKTPSTSCCTPGVLLSASSPLLCSVTHSYCQPWLTIIVCQRHYFANKVLSSQGYGFPSGHVWMWELDFEESWALKNWCSRTVVLEKILESPLDCKKIEPVNTKGNQPGRFIGRTDAEVEVPILWPPDAKSQLTGKDPDAGKGWGVGGDRGWDGWMASPTQWTGV